MKCTQCGSTEFLEAKGVYAHVNTMCNCIEGGGIVADFSEINVGEKFEERSGSFRGGMDVYLRDPGSLKAFVCKKCGHVEFFCDTYLLQEKAEREKEAEEKRIAAEKAAASAKIEENNKLIKELKEKAKDENITVKQQKEYLAQIDELEKVNHELKKKLK